MSWDPENRAHEELTPAAASSPHPAPAQRPEPPAYAEAARPPTAGARGRTDATVPPGTLYLASNQIYPGGGAGSSGASSSPPPLYELSLAVGFLTDRSGPVRLERLEYSVRQQQQQQQGAAAVPGVSVRRRHIYNLARAPGGGRGYAADPEVRAALGPIAVAAGHQRSLLAGSTGGGCQAWRLGRGGGGGRAGLGNAELLFEARPEGGGPRNDKVLRWFAYGRCAPDGEVTGTGDGGGGMGTGWLVAREDQDEADGLYRLVVLAPLDRPVRDALVAAWCCRICGDVVGRRSRADAGLAKFKRVMHIIRGPELITLKQRYTSS